MASRHSVRIFTALSRPVRFSPIRTAQISPLHIAARARTQLCRPGSHRASAQSPIAQKRWHSIPPSKSQVYNFEQIQDLSDSPTSDRILIDVREPHEYTAGFIPTALNIPINSNPDALFLPADEFEDRFGFPKPEMDKEVVFYCKAGVRSSAAAKLAEQGGYENIAEYRGSWLEWEKKGGKKEMP